MGEWIVAIILLLISILAGVAAALLCRVLGYRRLATCLGEDEEKAVLTKHMEHGNGYTVTDDADLHLDGSGKMVQYKTLSVDNPPYVALDDRSPPKEEPAATELDRISPVSVESTSGVSDMEGGSGTVGGGKLQRAISCESVASDSSVLEMQPDAPKIGQLEFGLEYDREVGELVVSVIQARDLEANEVTGNLDSYVKVWLNPSEEKPRHTKVQKGTTNPAFKERFLYAVEPETVDRQVVQFQVFSCDRYARHKLLGETEIRLGDISLKQSIRIWMNLRDMDEKPTDRGDIMFSLSYLPTAERLTVVVVKARNLKWSHGKDAGDSFVKVYLLQNGRKIYKKKTTTKREERNPIFNEAMIFSVPMDALQSVQLRITVAESLPESKISSVGHVIVGAGASGTELTHWNQMMSSLRKPVAMWHRLYK